MKLFSPDEYGFQPCNYNEASPELIKEVAGGCGPGGKGDMLVPDTIFFLSVTPACSIHDWMYHFGETFEDKEQADRVFLNNMLRIINNHGGLLRCFRIMRAITYYKAVKYFGGPSFWDNKI